MQSNDINACEGLGARQMNEETAIIWSIAVDHPAPKGLSSFLSLPFSFSSWQPV